MKMKRQESYPLLYWGKMNWILRFKGKLVVAVVVDWEMPLGVLDVPPLYSWS